MSKGPQKVRGTQDMIGAEADRFHRVVDAFDRVRRLYAFQHVEVPVFEATEVFARTLGETTDVVSKEMYTFEDRGGDFADPAPRIHRRHLPRLHHRRLAAIRADEDRHLRPGLPLRAPAKGPFPPVPPARRRDHRHRFEPAADVELLGLAAQLLRELGISDGCHAGAQYARRRRHARRLARGTCRAFRGARGRSFGGKPRPAGENPLRILDSKAPQDRPIAEAAPGIDDFLTADAAAFFADVTAGLDAAGVDWTAMPTSCEVSIITGTPLSSSSPIV